METRFYLGLAILLLLLILGIGTSMAMKAIHEPVQTALAEAAAQAHSGDLSQALPTAQSAYDRWQRFHSVTASFADHSPMDDTDTLFQEMLVYGQLKDIPHFIACCRQLMIMTEAMYDAHVFSLKNLL